ncbi:MAG: potassium channel protein [Acidimicrobiia bacterium]|nr:potassium channel protein [Acidimicrobiia bacterium]
MDDRPRNLRAMLAESKDTSELMVDLAYAAVYFGDPDMAEEVGELEDKLTELVRDMRGVCVLAARSPKESEAMSSVLQVVSAIERIGNDAVDVARVVTHKLGIPAQLLVDLAMAQEVSHRVLVSEGSHMANRPVSAMELPVATGMRIMAIRRHRDWIIDVDGDVVITPGDALFLRGSPDGITRLRELAAAPPWAAAQPAEDTVVTDLDRAVDVLVEMKNLSEAAVGLAYSALVLGDATLASEVHHLEDRLDEMKDRLELWVLRAAADNLDPSPLRGLLHLAEAAEDIGDQAQQMVRLVEDKDDVHPVLGLALGESDDVVMEVPVAKGSTCDGVTLSDLRLGIEPGFGVLAIRRGGAYLYRPRGHVRLHAGDELIASGPDEGRAMLAELCGWRLVEDEDTGEYELLPA